MQSGTREFYLRVLGASWVPSGGGVPLGAPWGRGEVEWCGEELFSIENVNISPASISDLVSPGII